jgi:hypothetical protein
VQALPLLRKWNAHAQTRQLDAAEGLMEKSEE